MPNRCNHEISRRTRASIIAGETVILPENPRVRSVDLQIYSTLAQVVELDRNCCFDVVSVKNGDIAFCCDRIEICLPGTYRVGFLSENEENIPLALTLNGDAVQSIVYKIPTAVNSGQVLLDLRRGDYLALTNKFSPTSLVMPENVINTVRVANASLSINKL